MCNTSKHLPVLADAGNLRGRFLPCPRASRALLPVDTAINGSYWPWQSERWNTYYLLGTYNAEIDRHLEVMIKPTTPHSGLRHDASTCG